MWAAPTILGLYLFSAETRFLVIVLALAALGTVMQLLSSMITRIGTHDEAAKTCATITAWDRNQPR
jgi:hypothetical protein